MTCVADALPGSKIKHMPPRKQQPSGEPKKSPRKGASIQAWINPEIREAVDAWIEGQELPPSLTSILEVALKEFLIKRDGWKPAKGGK